MKVAMISCQETPEVIWNTFRLANIMLKLMEWAGKNLCDLVRACPLHPFGAGLNQSTKKAEPR